jgi:hypothetical protein
MSVAVKACRYWPEVALSTVVHGVNLPKTRFLPLLRGIEGTDGDAAFKGIQRFGTVFSFQPQSFLVLFK